MKPKVSELLTDETTYGRLNSRSHRFTKYIDINLLNFKQTCNGIVYKT